MADALANLRVDVREVVGLFHAVASYAPQATSVALNRMAEWGTRIGREGARQRFTIRSEQALRYAFPVSIPGKERASPQKLAVTIEPQRTGKIFEPFEEGEPHGPDKLGRWPAIPSTGLLGVRPYPRAVIPKSLFPINLGLAPRRDPKGRIYYALGKGAIKKGSSPYRKTASGKTQMQGKRGTFQVEGAKGPVILQRLNATTVRSLWFLRPQVPRPTELEYFTSIQRGVNERGEHELKVAFDYYVALAESRGQRG